MIVDTDVLIWFFRGSDKANNTLNKLGAFSISDVVHMELLQGIRNKTELRHLKQYLAKHSVTNIPITTDISSRAIYLLERYALSHGLQIADALIAATADLHGQRLLTGNTSHYKMIPNLLIKPFRA